MGRNQGNTMKKCPCEFQRTELCNATCECFSAKFKTYQSRGLKDSECRAFEKAGRPASRSSFRTGFYAGVEYAKPDVEAMEKTLIEQERRHKEYNAISAENMERLKND